MAHFSDQLVKYRDTPHPSIRKRNAPYEVRVFSEVNPSLGPLVFAKILLTRQAEKKSDDSHKHHNM